MTSTSTLSRPPERTRTGAATLGARPGHEQDLVAEARARRSDRLSRAEARTALVTSGSFLAGAVAFALVAHSSRTFHLAAALVLVGGFALLSQLELEIGGGSTVPTQLVFVSMLFVLPLPLVPVSVCLGYLAGGAADALRGHARLVRAAALPGCSWFSLPPALILFAFDRTQSLAWHRWPVYAAALAAQCVGDLAHTSVHEWLAHRISPARLLRPLGRVYLFDALLSPVALLAAITAGRNALSVLVLIPLAGVFAALAHERRARHDSELKAAQLNALAHTDALTGLANRRALDGMLERLVTRGGTDFGVCLIDLDRFKAYNDRYGHPAGDALLQEAADAWSAQLRPGDLLARYGGEEFALLLPDCPPATAVTIAARLCDATPAPATCSGGLACWDGSETVAALKHRADTALYEAKDAGRARLVIAG